MRNWLSVRSERRKITVDARVGQYFAQLPNDDRAGTTNATDQLMETLRELSRSMGGKPWSNRDELDKRFLDTKVR